MSTDLRAPSRTSLRAFSVIELLMILFLVALLISILLPSLSRARQLAKRAVCAANARGLGQGFWIYANDYDEWFPRHYYRDVEEGADTTKPHHVRWVGTMGSSDALRVSEQTSPTKSPEASHPSRSLFLSITLGNAMPATFVCPSSGDREDELRNYGPDAGEAAARASQPGFNRFDFLGYDRLSYGYQLPYGAAGKPRMSLDPRVVILADKGPYYQAGQPGLEGTDTRRDALAGKKPPELSGQDADVLASLRDADRWRAYNSRNHRGEGQNTLYGDGHVEFAKTPFAGLNFDNVYTIQAAGPQGGELKAAAGGTVPGADERLGPRSDKDTFLVP